MSTRAAWRSKAAGLTLIELVMFIVIVSVGIIGILIVFNATVRGSADPMIRKNMLSIAEALLEEVEAMPFTYCDPDDSKTATATQPSDCTMPEGIGPEPPETTRIGNATNPFDNVSDYVNLDGTAISGDTQGLGDATHAIKSLDGTGSAPLGYTATIAVANDASLGPTGLQVPLAGALRITVTVTHGSNSVTLEGYRARYAPFYSP